LFKLFNTPSADGYGTFFKATGFEICHGAIVIDGAMIEFQSQGAETLVCGCASFLATSKPWRFTGAKTKDCGD
jgi:hypothetical protein